MDDCENSEHLSGTDLEDIERAASDAARIGRGDFQRTRRGVSAPAKVVSDLAGAIEDTVLSPIASHEEIIKKCVEVPFYRFRGICINPRWVRVAADCMSHEQSAIITVIGFPLGASPTDTKIFETEKALQDGADEFDMVADLSALRDLDLGRFADDIASVVEAAGGAPVKVILECGLLNGTYEKALGAFLAAQAGAAFVKTSTGFAFDRSGTHPIPLGATCRDVRILSTCVSPALGVKAAGGIVSRAQAISLIEAGATRIGTSRGSELLA